MRKPYGKLILVLAAMALVTGGCQKKGNTVETDASTEAVVTESATAREPILEETWSWLVQTYKLLEANYETGQKLVEDGLATQTEDPGGSHRGGEAPVGLRRAVRKRRYDGRGWAGPSL